MDFSAALAHLKTGHLVAREGWNGRGMFLYLVEGSTFEVNRPPLAGIFDDGTVINYRSHIDMFDAQGFCVPWLASQTDMLAEDWSIVTKPSYMRDSFRAQESERAAAIARATDELNASLAVRAAREAAERRNG